MLNYTVRKADAGWLIEQGGNTYLGYSSEAAALKAALGVAEKISRRGHESQVTLHPPSDPARVVWVSENRPATIDNILQLYGTP